MLVIQVMLELSVMRKSMNVLAVHVRMVEPAQIMWDTMNVNATEK